MVGRAGAEIQTRHIKGYCWTTLRCPSSGRVETRRGSELLACTDCGPRNDVARLGCHYCLDFAADGFAVRIPDRDLEIVVWLLVLIQSAAVPVPIECPAGLHRNRLPGDERGALPNLDPRIADPLRYRVIEVPSIFRHGEWKRGGRSLLGRLAKATNKNCQADQAAKIRMPLGYCERPYAIDVTAV
jgi:hypothetical protein